MKIIIVVVAAMLSAIVYPPDFLTEQKRFARVRTAFDEKEQSVRQKLGNAGRTTSDFHMMLVAYKDDDKLELHVRNKSESQYRLLTTYEICARSGGLGPKRRQGDYQVPEGFYHINMFNPNSNFFLSLGINYPNTGDRRKTTATDPGGSIFIHGSCVTIGCLPMTDDKIKELYVYAVHAKNNGQARIPVYIFPFRMTNENFAAYKRTYAANTPLIDFWSNLKKGYDLLNINRSDLQFAFESNGDYRFTTSLQ